MYLWPSADLALVAKMSNDHFQSVIWCIFFSFFINNTHRNHSSSRASHQTTKWSLLLLKKCPRAITSLIWSLRQSPQRIIKNPASSQYARKYPEILIEQICSSKHFGKNSLPHSPISNLLFIYSSTLWNMEIKSGRKMWQIMYSWKNLRNLRFIL